MWLPSATATQSHASRSAPSRLSLSRGLCQPFERRVCCQCDVPPIALAEASPQAAFDPHWRNLSGDCAVGSLLPIDGSSSPQPAWTPRYGFAREAVPLFYERVRGAQQRSVMGTSVLSASHDAATLPMSPFLLSHFPSDEGLDTAFLDALGVRACLPR